MLDFFENGVTSLNEKKFQDVTRAEKPKTEVVCACGFVMPPSAQSCPVCGRERSRRGNDIEEVAGEMVSIDALSKASVDGRDRNKNFG